MASTKFENAVINFAKSTLPYLEEYRAKNVNKYHREDELPFKEYTKLERYKNRVRIVDIIIPALRVFLAEMKDPEEAEYNHSVQVHNAIKGNPHIE